MPRTLARQCAGTHGGSDETGRKVTSYLSRFRRQQLACLISAFALLAAPLRLRSQVTPFPIAPDRADSANPPKTGSIRGMVLDKDGAAIPNAKVVLTEPSFKTEAQSAGDGTFTFQNVPAAAYDLSYSAPGFADQHQTGTIQPGENDTISPVHLVVATTVEVNVTQTREEIAQEQIHIEEKQRLFGVVPNYFVTYTPDAVPLNTRQKFHLGWKFAFDPVSIGMAGAIAGIEQANNSYSGYGQGMQGYAKRFGASYADFVAGTFFGNVIFPTLLKQDPRYFYKGTGSRKSRFFYAIANAVICKGDNGHWQPNYSNVLGSLAAGGLSNLYYPASDRNGAGLTFENAMIGVGGSAAAAVFQEFFSKKLTPHARDRQASQ